MPGTRFYVETYSGHDEPSKEREASKPLKVVMIEHEGAQLIHYHDKIKYKIQASKKSEENNSKSKGNEYEGNFLEVYVIIEAPPPLIACVPSILPHLSPTSSPSTLPCWDPPPPPFLRFCRLGGQVQHDWTLGVIFIP